MTVDGEFYMSKSKQIKNNMTAAVATVMLSLTGAVLA